MSDIDEQIIGEVKKKYNNKIVFVKKVEEKDNNKDDFYEKLKGPNFINIVEIRKNLRGINYKLIFMEKAMGNIKDLYQNNPLLNLRFNPFNDNIGDNLLRFFTKQIIDCLEIMDRNYLVHSNIRPENILMFQNLIFKLSNFNLLKNIKDQEQFEIPKEKKVNIASESFSNESVSKEVDKKQDYISFGLTLFFLKYGSDMLIKNIFNNKEDEKIRFQIPIILQKIISQIASDQSIEKDLIDFLRKLLNYSKEDKFENIYRNKWLNKNNKEQREIMIINHNDNKKAIIEFQKSDFLIGKKKDLYKHKKKFKFKKKDFRNKMG
jgi:serine/threonine protein kinase